MSCVRTVTKAGSAIPDTKLADKMTDILEGRARPKFFTFPKKKKVQQGDISVTGGGSSRSVRSRRGSSVRRKISDPDGDDVVIVDKKTRVYTFVSRASCYHLCSIAYDRAGEGREATQQFATAQDWR